MITPYEFFVGVLVTLAGFSLEGCQLPSSLCGDVKGFVESISNYEVDCPVPGFEPSPIEDDSVTLDSNPVT